MVAHWMGPWEQTSVKFKSRNNNFNTRKWKFFLQNREHFVSASMGEEKHKDKLIMWCSACFIGVFNGFHIVQQQLSTRMLRIHPRNRYLYSMCLTLGTAWSHNIPRIKWWRHDMETLSALLAFVRGIHRSPVDSLHKGPVMPNFYVSPNKLSK